MKTRTLGNTGYRVSEIGFGGWGIGGEMWRGVDDSEGRKALREAVDQGITFFDTALAYGNGHSERIIGEVLKDDIRANRTVVATKIPPLNRQWPGKAGYKLADVFPAHYIASCTETSLKNLGVEALHVQQLHVWNDAWLQDRDWGASYQQIVRLKEEGKVLHWGVSINDHAPETALRVLDDPVETLPELALRFCLSSREVSTVIPGMRRPAHVRQNATASARGALPAGM